jgi:hypothetical protein
MCLPALEPLSIFLNFSPFTFALGRPSLYAPSADAQAEKARKELLRQFDKSNDEALCF